MLKDQITDKVRKMILQDHNTVEEKKMFGGLCFMVDEKMCICISKQERLMFRVDPADAEKLAEAGDCTLMHHNGRKMTGFVYVDLELLEDTRTLKKWVDRSLAFNKKVETKPKKKNS